MLDILFVWFYIIMQDALQQSAELGKPYVRIIYANVLFDACRSFQKRVMWSSLVQLRTCDGVTNF